VEKRAPSRRLWLLLCAGIALIGAAWWLRSSPRMREAILRGKDLPELEAAVRQNPNDGLARYYLAKRYYLNRRFEDARIAYEEVVRLDPNSARAHLGLALSWYELGQTWQAREEFQRALALDDRLAWAEYMLAKMAWAEDNINEALPHVKRATQLDPRSDQAWFGLAACYTQLRNYDGAVQALRKAVARREDRPRYHTALADLLVFRGQIEEGRRHYERALQLDPNYGPACALLGRFLLTKATDPDALERAEELLTRATRLQTVHPQEVWLDLGRLHLRKGRFTKAVEALQNSLRLEARDERAYYALANAYRRMGNAKAAAAAAKQFQRISKLHVRMQGLEARVFHRPGALEAHLDLARVYRDLGMLRQAAQQYAAYLRKKPESPAVVREFDAFMKRYAPMAAQRRAQDFVVPSPQENP
jgi:tetratricopeptide (TPR) repeat protein